MPFGLTNASASFQALVNDILRPYLNIFVLAYLDDILIYSKTHKEHVQHVTSVLEALRNAGMRIQREKYAFYKQEVEFLEFILSTEGVRMDSKKLEAIEKWLRSKNTTEV
jgi:hypothetical protein